MGIFSKLYYHTWNIGFIEQKIDDVIVSTETKVHVHWVKHHYKDRFFADPFILSVDDKIINVLVEDFPYYHKKGLISLLVIDRKDYRLLERKVILKQPFHMSYPFIQRNEDGSVRWVAPEASASGHLYRYAVNPSTHMLEGQKVLMNEPLLDSTIIKHNGLFWLFCTKKGIDSNRSLYVYYSEKSEGPWTPHKNNPVVEDAAIARPAGYVVEVKGVLYRVIQKCDKHYGEAINVSRIDVCNENEFRETHVKELRAQGGEFSGGFHTINGLDGLCVVDGVKVEFRPVHRIWYEFRNFLNKSL